MMNEMMMMGSALAVLWMVLPLVLLPFLYIYLLQDFQGRREGKRDPNLGTQVLLTAMMTIGAQLVIGGMAMVAAAVVGDGNGDDAVKTGLGMAVGGLVASAFPAFIYFTRTRTEGEARIGHKALGLNAAVCGLAFTLMATITSISAFHSEDVAEPAAVALVYLAGCVFTVLRLVKNPLPPAEIAKSS